MSLPWFRTYTRLIDDEKLKLLAFEDRWHFMAILCCKGQGILDNPGELMRRKVSVKLGLAVRELDEVARRLSEVGLIDADTLQPVSWDKLQFVSDIDRQNAFRQREYRKRVKEGWSEYIAKQDGKCACCGKDFETPYAKYVVRDHDHRTGAGRGLVCQSCNKLIGQVESGRSCDKSKLLMINDYLSSYVSVTLRNGLVTAPDTDSEAETYPEQKEVRRTTKKNPESDPEPKRETSKRTPKVKRPDDVSEDTWDGFVALRRAKKAPVSDAALKGIRREADKAAVSMDEALQTCCARGWTGFKADWMRINDGKDNWRRRERSDPLAEFTAGAYGEFIPRDD